MARSRKEWSEDALGEYHRGWRKGPSEAWHPPADVLDDEAIHGHVNGLLDTALPVDVLDLDLECPVPWPRSWTWRVHRRILMYHPEYSHTKGARKYYDFSAEELFCSMCVKLDIDYDAATEMDAWEVLRVVYERLRELRVPEQTATSRFPVSE